MTIGIAAFGPQAGLAVYKGLQIAERVGWGSIGGFACLAVIDATGELRYFQTQRGGSSTLFVDGDLTGLSPPPTVSSARIAALMSSGPDRPEPLSQFVPGDPTVGLVTGHRLPNTPGADGRILNQDVLLRMKQGNTPQQAVDSVLDANLQADAGLIALDLAGNLYARNSDRVQQRPDLGHARREAGDLAVEVLHNAIHPAGALAALVADTTMETMLPQFHPDQWVEVNAGISVRLGPVSALMVDDKMNAIEVITTDAGLLRDYSNGAAIYIGSAVMQNGRQLGSTVTEPYVVLEQGRIVSLSGQKQLRVGFRKHQN